MKRLAILLALAAGAPALLGCGSNSAGPGGDAAPIVPDGGEPRARPAPALSPPPGPPHPLPVTGGAVTISANATDDVRVSTVTAQVKKGTTVIANLAMAKVTGALYRRVWTAPRYEGVAGTSQVYTVVVSARDNTNLTGTAAPLTVTVRADADAPAIRVPLVSPSTLRFTGGPVTISADVSDALGVSKVWAEITKAGSTAVTTVAMPLTSGRIYRATWTVPAVPSGAGVQYTVKIRAQDRARNASVSPNLAVTVQPVVAPPLPGGV